MWQSLVVPPHVTLPFSRVNPRLTNHPFNGRLTCSPLQFPISSTTLRRSRRRVQCSLTLPPFEFKNRKGWETSWMLSSKCVIIKLISMERSTMPVMQVIVNMSGDKFVVRVGVTDSSAARFHFEHRFYKLPNLEPILEGKANVVWLDKNYRPIRIPTEIRSKLVQQGGTMLKASYYSLINNVSS